MGGATNEKALGASLQLARKRSGLTQQELCHKTGLSYSTLAKIERGAIKTPSVFTVATIAQATGTSVEELLGIKGKSTSGLIGATDKKVSKTGVRFVYFDVNGVVVRFFHRAFVKIAEETGSSADAVETLFWRHNDAACRGQLSVEDLNRIFAKELELPDFNWEKYYLEGCEPTPKVGELVSWAAEHYEVGLLTNSMPGFIDKLKQLGLIPNVSYTAVVDSSKVGLIKPDQKIYEIANQLAAVEPHEILLVDDTRSNLTAADRFGWHVLWFDDYQPEESVQRIRESLAF